MLSLSRLSCLFRPTTKRIAIIAMAACDPVGVIGVDGVLPWNIPEEVAFFRKIVAGHTIIVGRKTFESLPESLVAEVYPRVLSRTARVASHAGGALFFTSWHDCLEDRSMRERSPFFLIGGGEVFQQAILSAHIRIDYCLISHLKQRYSGDVFFPIEALKNKKKKEIYRHRLFCTYLYEM